MADNDIMDQLAALGNDDNPGEVLSLEDIAPTLPEVVQFDDDDEEPAAEEAEAPAEKPVVSEIKVTPRPDNDSGNGMLIMAKSFVFQALFEKAHNVIPTKDLLPVLKNFQVEATDNGVRVMATDMELSVISTTEIAEVHRPGTAVFPAKKILDIFKEADADIVVIDVNDNEAKITAGTTSWTLKLQSGDDYPDLPEVANVTLYPFDRVKFLGAVNSVRYAAPSDQTRPNLLMLNISGGKMVACDGARYQQAMLGTDFPLDMQLPVGAIDDLVKLLRTTDLEMIGIGETENFLVFKVGYDVFIANKMMQQFPNVEKVLLEPAMRNNFNFNVDREELFSAIKRVKINADPETSAIVLGLDKDKLRVSAQDKYGNASDETIGCSWQLAPRDVVLNHKFLMDMLNMYDGKSCAFRIGEDSKSRKSSLLLEDNDTGTLGLIQQMRQDWVTDEA